MYNNNYGGYGASSAGSGPPPDLSAYWKKDGSSAPATGPWGLGGYGFTSWTGGSNVNGATDMGFASVGGAGTTISGLLLGRNGYARLFGGNVSGTIYSSLECFADGGFELTAKNDAEQGVFNCDPLTGTVSFVATGSNPGAWSYNALDGMRMLNTAEVASYISNEQVTEETIYELPAKPAGREVFAMQSDILLLTLYGLS